MTQPLHDDPLWPRASDWLAGGGAGGTGALDLAVLGIPAHRTSLSPTSAHETPAAIRAALARYSAFAESRQVDLADLAVADLGDVADPDSDEDASSAAALDAATRARTVVFIGGDNSITFAAARGVLGPDLARAGLVTVDAHHDLRDGVSNGSPVQRLIEHGLDPTRIVQVGIADFANSKAYSDRARTHGIRVISRGDVGRRGIAECVRDGIEAAGRMGGPVYVDLDLDVCDRDVAPGCPASAPGGLSAQEARDAAYAAGLHPQVRALDLVEVDALADTADQRTVRLAALCLLEFAAGLGRRLQLIARQPLQQR